METKDITYFAETDFRGKKTKFGIKNDDRGRHVYVIGKTGMGKSTMLENMAVQDIQNGHGVAFIDPHGSTAEKLLDYVPTERIKDVVYFAPFDLDNPISFNVMEDVGRDERHLVVNGLMSAFKKIWVDAWSARMEYILTNVLLALLEYPGSTLLGVNRMIADKDYRKKVVDNVKDPSVRSFWVDEFAKYTERFAAEATPAIQNKIGQFTSNPLIRNIIGQTKSSFSFRQMMDEKKILIINLSKGRMGEGNANLIGSMLITKIYLAAMSRANVTPSEMRVLPPFYFFVDEFQSFANESFANILSEARKYKLSLTIAHQYIEQMSEEVSAAVFGNVGTIVSFRVGPFDAEVFEKIYSPTFLKEDMVNLGFAQVYLTLMIDGVGSPPFSSTTLPPLQPMESSHREEIIANSRKIYARPREMVEKDIVGWHEADRPVILKIPPRPPPLGGMGLSRPPASQPWPRTPQPMTVRPPGPPPATPRPLGPIRSATPATSLPPRPQSVPSPLPPNQASTPKTISLSSLQTEKSKEKSGGGKHLADLRQVLQDVQKEIKAKPNPASNPIPHSPPVPPPPKSEKSEVPEEVLKKMLEL